MSFELRTSDGTVVAVVEKARGIIGRARGLIGRSDLPPGRGLLLEPARQVHTFGMRFRIDVVFCDADGRVLHVESAMGSNRLSRFVRGARYVVELPAGGAGKIAQHDVLTLIEVDRPDR